MFCFGVRRLDGAVYIKVNIFPFIYIFFIFIFISLFWEDNNERITNKNNNDNDNDDNEDDTLAKYIIIKTKYIHGICRGLSRTEFK